MRRWLRAHPAFTAAGFHRTHPRRRVSRLQRFFTLMVLLGATLAGFVTPALAAGRIWFDLTLQDAADSLSPVTALPQPSDIVVEPADSAATAIVVSVLTNLSASPATDSTAPQLGQPGEEFIESLKVLLATRGLTFADGFDLSDAAPAGKNRIGVTYTLAAPPPPDELPQAFEIWIRTAFLPEESPALHWSVRDLAASARVRDLLRAQRGDSPAADAIALPADCTLVVLPAAGPWLRPAVAGTPDDPRFTPLFAAAVATAETAFRRDALRLPRTFAHRTTLGGALHDSCAAWPLAGEISWADELSNVENCYLPPARAVWALRLTGFDPVERQVVKVDSIQLGRNGPLSWAAFVAQQQAAGRDIAALVRDRAAFEERLNAALARSLPWGEPRFATAADHAARIAALRREPGVAAVESQVFRDTAAYSVLWYPRLTTLEASGTYNSDRGGNLSGKFGVQTRDFSLGVEGYLANRRRGLFADVTSTPRLTRWTDQATMTWGVLGDTTRDSPVRLGTPQNFSLREAQARGGIRWQLDGAHHTGPTAGVTTTAGLQRTRNWKVEAIAGYRHARLSAANFGFAGRADGAAPFGSVELGGEWTRLRPATADAPAVAGRLQTKLTTDASPSTGDTAAFARVQFLGTGELRAGSGRFENALVRVTSSAAIASDATPLAWNFRLGGDERMRGFELGELAGRAFVHVGAEAGVALGSWLKPRPPAAPGTPPPPFELRQLRVLLGIEHAWVDDPPRFIPAAPSLTSGASYALTAEYGGPIPGLPRDATLALGYGYAPRSSHRSGRVFVTLRVPLSLPQP